MTFTAFYQDIPALSILVAVTFNLPYRLYFGRPLVCFNALHLEGELDRIPAGVSSVCLHITDLVTLMDHTTAATCSISSRTSAAPAGELPSLWDWTG